MDTEEMYDQSLSKPRVAERRWAQSSGLGALQHPEGQPVPTGYYPHVRGQLRTPITVGPCYDNLYRPTVVGALDFGTEAIDQHPWIDVTATWTPPANVERPSGVQDPLTDGPPQPTIRDLSLHYRRERGASVTAYLNVPGHEFPPNGNQDGASWTYFQDPRRGLVPYDPAQTSGGQMPDTMQAMPPSPAHGWTMRPLVNSQAAINAKTADLVQQQPPKAELLANSAYVGQTYGQTTARVGQSAPGSAGTVPTRRTRG